MRQWETSRAHKQGLRSQRQWFPCQQDLCWESPPFKCFPSRTSATEGLVGIGEGISCGWQMKMQLCRSKMEMVRVKSPQSCCCCRNVHGPVSILYTGTLGLLFTFKYPITLWTVQNCSVALEIHYYDSLSVYQSNVCEIISG